MLDFVVVCSIIILTVVSIVTFVAHPFGMDLQREREVVAALDQIAATGLRGAPKGEPKFN